jgi:sporulation protein YpjB
MRHIASAEGIEALAQSVVRMKRAVAAMAPDPDKWKSGAAEIRLAADALSHPDNPLWHRYRTVLVEDVLSLRASLSKSGVSAASQADLERLKRHYQLIRTSVLLRSETYRTERADSVLRYAGRLLASSSTDPDLLSRLVPSLQESMDGLFPSRGKDKAAVVPPMAGPPWGWSAFMGTFIVSVLTWVGWRRYQGVDRVTPRGSPPPERHERR